MHITALTGAAAAKLRSAQVVTDSVSLIKELIDNALDAGANNIIITAAANLLDSIKVTDNGRGVPAQDRPLLGKRSHTSKIQTLSDLEALGGASLGFRGEALASIAQLSEKGLVIITRVESESMGSRLTIDRQGCLIKHETTPTGVGTVVLVQDVLKTIPVRYNCAMRTAKKDSARLKDLVRSYAFARPGVRLRLKLVGLKEKNAGFDYIPPKGVPVSLANAALSLMGRAFLAGCISQAWPCEADTCLSGGYAFEALLPNPEMWRADSWCPGNCGQYVVIDSRPISVKRGIGKDLVKSLKECMNAAGRQPLAKTPFLALAIHCPPHSYDVNVEPAKDDVAFVDPSKVLSLIDTFFGEVYRTRRTADQSEYQPFVCREESRPDDGSDFPVEEQSDREQRDLVPQHQVPSRHPSSAEGDLKKTGPRSERRACIRFTFDQTAPLTDEGHVDDKEGEVFAEASPALREPVEQLPPVVTNPWTLAQLQKPGKNSSPDWTSSDTILPVKGQVASVRLPPTPSSSIKPLAKLLRNTPENCMGPEHLPHDHTTALQPDMNVFCRQLSFDTAPRLVSSSTSKPDASLDDWLELQQQQQVQPADSYGRLKSSQSPGIALNDIPDIRQLRKQCRSSAAKNPPFRPVVKRNKDGRQLGTELTTSAARSQIPGFERQTKICFEPSPEYDSDSCPTAVFPYASCPDPRREDARSPANSLSPLRHQSNAADFETSHLASRDVPVIEEDDQLFPKDCLVHREQECCSRLVWTSDQTTTVIANMALDEPQLLVIHDWEASFEYDSLTFKNWDRSDTERWRRAIWLHMARLGVPDDCLENLEFDPGRTLKV